MPLPPAALPTSGDLLLFAPTNKAFEGALAKLNLTIADILANPSLAADVLKLHIAGATSMDATSATALDGSTLTFMVKNASATVAQLVKAGSSGTGTVMDSDAMETPTVISVVSCPAQNQTAFVIDEVLIPSMYESMGPSMAPGEAPAMAPSMAPSMAPTGPITIGEAVAGLCPNITDALKNYTILTEAVNAVANTTIDIPAGMQLVLAAPTDAAFEALLSKLNVSPAALLANKDLLLSVLEKHISVLPSEAGTSATTLSSDAMDFLVNNATTPLMDLLDSVMAGAKNAALKVTNSTSLPQVLSAAGCPGMGQYLLGIDEVIAPDGLISESPAMAPSMEPTVAPVAPAEAPAASSAASVAFGLTTAAALAAALIA